MRAVAFVVALPLAALGAWPGGSAAQSTTPIADTQPGRTTGTQVTNGGSTYSVSGGQVRGTNLFHSFQEFGVPTDGTVAFIQPNPTGPAVRIDNVLSRVTGGVQSLIDGTLSTRALDTPGVNTNFFLINPSGVMFGPGAILDVSGAVRVSTADYIRLDNGQEFSATNPSEVPLGPLFSAPPQAFGFLPDNHGMIDVVGAQLLVDPEQVLSLVGGDVNLSGGAILFAPGGLAQVVSVASPGRVDFTAADLGLSQFSQLGRITIAEGSGIAAGGNDFGVPSGTVMIRGGHLVIDSGGIIITDAGDLAGADLGVDIDVRESMTVRDFAAVQTFALGSADGPAVSIKANNLAVSEGGTIQSSTDTAAKGGRIDIQVGSANFLSGSVIQTLGDLGDAGNLTIAARETITISGSATEIGSKARGAAVVAGDISLTAANMILNDRAIIRSGDDDTQGGGIAVNVQDTLAISGLAGISSLAFTADVGTVDISAARLLMDSGFISATTLATGKAGTISVRAGEVRLTNGAQIASSSLGSASGAGGSIVLNVVGAVTISGIGPQNGVSTQTFTGAPNSGIFTTTSTSGNAGQITVITPTLMLSDGGRISVTTEGSGNAGTVIANVGTFSITGSGRVDSSTTSGGKGGDIAVNGALSISGAGSGLFSTTSTGTGDAGAITVTAPTLTLADGGTISVTTVGAGDAGTIVANVGNLNVTGGGRVDSSTTAGGAGGAITVNGTLAIAGAGSGLFSTASSTGAAGAINATGPNLTVAGGGTIDSSTTGAGAGGAINLSAAGQVEISGGGSVRADSLGAGNTGSVNIAAGDRIVMTDGSISTRAATSDGGNITLTAPNIIRLGNSQISTSVQSGRGAGGNIFIDPQFVILNGSSITANAFGGPGGNITIIADNFLTDPTSFVQASSALSTPGSVLIQSPDNNVASDIAQLPRELVDASRLLRGGCSARRTSAPSSFMVGGRGGVPVDPDGYLPSFSASAAPAAGARGAAVGPGFALAMAGWDCWR